MTNILEMLKQEKANLKHLKIKLLDNKTKLEEAYLQYCDMEGVPNYSSKQLFGKLIEIKNLVALVLQNEFDIEESEYEISLFKSSIEGFMDSVRWEE